MSLPLLPLALLAIGEGLNIWAEMLAARLPETASLLELRHAYLFAMIVVGAVLLLAGYLIGYRETKNIWFVTAAAIAVLLIIEPALAWGLFRQLPEHGSLIGLILGITGLFITLFWR